MEARAFTEGQLQAKTGCRPREGGHGLEVDVPGCVEAQIGGV